jgi:hypothetical protein
MKSGTGRIASDFVSDAKAPVSLTFRSGSGGASIQKSPELQ